MEEVSTKEFFTVMWKGVCQVWTWFWGLFGYKKEGTFAKVVWRVFALSSAVVMAVFALTMVYVLIMNYMIRPLHHGGPCYSCQSVDYEFYFHSYRDGKGYVYNNLTGKKLIKNVDWIAKPMDGDSLVCYSDGRKRGYFSNRSGRVIVKPKYDHAWIFSEGMAGVEEDGYVRFIDCTGKVVLDPKLPYREGSIGYVFHGDYCVVASEDGRFCGLMDRQGNLVLPMDYTAITPSNDFSLWMVAKKGEVTIYDRELNVVIPTMAGRAYFSVDGIEVTMSDRTMRKYDMQGNLINDFYITGLRMLEYDKDEVVYSWDSCEDGGEDPEPRHMKGTANLRAYDVEGYEGLMTADGRIVTMPLYHYIEAIGPDLYLCTTNGGNKVLVNGNGEMVRLFPGGN